MRRVAYLVLTYLLSSTVHADASDEGVINELYTDSSDNLVIKLETGFPNATAANECPTNNGWARVLDSSPVLKANLLAAKASRTPVSVVISGCTANGSWLRVIAAYAK